MIITKRFRKIFPKIYLTKVLLQHTVVCNRYVLLRKMGRLGNMNTRSNSVREVIILLYIILL